MKKYLTFAVSFVVLFLLFQVISGVILTSVYTPNISEAWNSSAMLQQEVMIKGGSPLFLSLIIALLSATIAYFIPKKTSR